MTILSRTEEAERLWEALTSLKEYRRLLLEYHSLRLHGNDQSFEANVPLGDKDDEPYFIGIADEHELAQAASQLETALGRIAPVDDSPTVRQGSADSRPGSPSGHDFLDWTGFGRPPTLDITTTTVPVSLCAFSSSAPHTPRSASSRSTSRSGNPSTVKTAFFGVVSLFVHSSCRASSQCLRDPGAPQLEQVIVH